MTQDMEWIQKGSWLHTDIADCPAGISGVVSCALIASTRTSCRLDEVFLAQLASLAPRDLLLARVTVDCNTHNAYWAPHTHVSKAPGPHHRILQNMQHLMSYTHTTPTELHTHTLKAPGPHHRILQHIQHPVSSTHTLKLPGPYHRILQHIQHLMNSPNLLSSTHTQASGLRERTSTFCKLHLYIPCHLPSLLFPCDTHI